MKKNILLLLTIVLTHSIFAQENYSERRKSWFDLQVAQHIGLNSWSNVAYANAGFPANALTEFRGALNFYISYPVGAFIDMGVGIMPAPSMRSLSLDRFPMPHQGTQYYLRDILSESGNSNASAHFKASVGLFGNIPAAEKLTVMPYFGIGLLSPVSQRKYEVLLKEHGSNMQYQAIYSWNHNNSNEYDEQVPLGYLTGRLNFNYKLSSKSSLLLGLEYMWFMNTLDFYGKYTNTFNANIQKDFSVKGNNMNMLGVSVGISFR